MVTAGLLALSLRVAEDQIALSLHTSQPQLSEHMPAGRRIRRYERTVAFDTHTDTLLLGVEYNDHSDHIEPIRPYWKLVLLSRNRSEWVEVQRLTTSMTRTSDIAVCGSRVLLERDDRVHVFDVSAEHRMSAGGTVALENENEFWWLACTRRIHT